MIELNLDFYEIIKKGLPQEDYKKNYDLIVEHAKTRGLNKKNLDYYTEEHHIIPKCLGGNNEKTNLVLLTAKEHIIAHILLYRIYPDNSSISHAANCMTLLVNSKDRCIEIENLDINILAELREHHSDLLKKSIVCYTKKLNDDSIEVITVCKIYESISDTELDGFNKSCITKARDEGRTYCDYYWSTLTDAEELFPQSILEYRNNLSDGNVLEDIYHIKKTMNIEKTGDSIICFKDGIVYREYKNLSDCSTDGFCIHNVCTVLKKRRDDHLGYRWLYKTEFETIENGKQLLDDFNKLTELPKLILPSNKIICCDLDENIYRIYNILSDVVLDGFNKGDISSALSKNGSGTFKSGYYWYKFNDWKNKDKLLEYEELLKLGKLPKLEVVKLKSPSIIIKCDIEGEIDEIYRYLSKIKSNTSYSIKSLTNLFKNNIDSLEDIESRQYKGFYWFRVLEFNKLFPGKLEKYISYEDLDESLEKTNTALNLVLTVSSKLISVNELYKAKVVNNSGRCYPVLYKNPKAVKVSEEIRNQLLSVDFSKYINWLKKTKKYSITINFVLKSGISQRDCANFEKIMCDDLVKFIKKDLGIDHFDDSEFLELRLIKSIIPNAKNEYALIQLRESKHDIRFDHIYTPERIYLSGPLFPIESDWKKEISPYLISNGLTFYDPALNFLDPEIKSVEKYDKCNTVLYTLFPGIFEQEPEICSHIIEDIDFASNKEDRFLLVGILGNEEDWCREDHSKLNILFDLVKKQYQDCSRIKVKFISKPEEILKA